MIKNPDLKRFVPYNPRTINGFHGCSISIAKQAVVENQLHPSRNVYDWLGHGIYFWEDSESRARQWAETNHGSEPAVIRAKICLGHCLDLFDTNWEPLLKKTYENIKAEYIVDNRKLPENKGSYRPLDCMVINRLAESLKVDTVRGAFLEGNAVYPLSVFVGLTHIQVVVREPKAIISPLEYLEVKT
jgi:hypothetical protein